MRATWDKLEKNWMQFEVEIDAEQFAKAIDSAFRRLNQRVTVPGFRRGKAPRLLFERHYGKDVLLQEAVDALLPRAYGEAVMANRINPIDQPEVEVIQTEEGKPFLFKGKVQVIPEVTLGRLSGFGIEKTVVEITPEEVDQNVENLRNRLSTLTTDESGEVTKGSHAVIDFEGFQDGEPFEGGKAENYSLEIGSGTFIPGFEDQMVGARVSETRNVDVVFPEEYHIEQLAGKEALFKVTVKEVKRKELPELNDDFAKQMGFETLQELRSDAENRLKDMAKANSERDFQEKVLDAVAEEALVEIPELLIDQRVDSMIHDFEHRLKSQGYSLEVWSAATGKSQDDLRGEMQESAAKNVKRELVLGAVARQSGIDVTESDVESEFDQLQAQMKGQEKEVKKLRQNAASRERLREELLTRKTIAHLVALHTTPQA